MFVCAMIRIPSLLNNFKHFNLFFMSPELPSQAVLFIFQPADWEEREYIEDPNQVKPEVGSRVYAFMPIDSLMFFLLDMIYYLVSQGYDSIPREIPDPKAKQVSGLSHVIHSLWFCQMFSRKLMPIFLIAVLNFNSLIPGMKMTMVYGDHQRYQIQHTRGHGNQRYE